MKRTIFFILVALLIITLVSGCSPARRVEPNDDSQNQNYNNGNTEMIPENNTNRTLPENNTDMYQGDNNNIPGDDDARSKRVADIAKDIDGVNKATVVVSGNTAYVGIDMEANAKEEETNKLKEKVGEEIKDREATITKVYVSADSDTITRLEDIGEDIKNGKPISGFLEELTEMFRRPTPSVQ